MIRRRIRHAISAAGLAMALLTALGGRWAQAEEKPTVLVELDGSGSTDPDGDPLHYRWSQVGGPEVILSDMTSPKPFFRTTQAGLYRFQLVVSDGKMESSPAMFEVLVERTNLAPLARVPERLQAGPGEKVLIDGTRSYDEDGDRLTYVWRQISGPPLYLTAELCREPKLSFVPKDEGEYAFELVVADKRTQSEPVVCRIQVEDKNQAPVARIQGPKTVTIGRLPTTASANAEEMRPERSPIAVIETPEYAGIGSTVALDGRGSMAQDNANLKFLWKQVDGPFVRSFGNDVDGVLTFKPETPGTYTFRLVVNDGTLDSRPVEKIVKVVEQDAAPVAVADAPKKGLVGRHIRLDGSKSFDRESKSLEYYWRQTAGPNVKKYFLGKEGSSCPAFLPDEAGTYTFELTVSDGVRRSEPSAVNVQVDRANTPPSLTLAGDLKVRPGEAAVLSAQGVDQDGDSLEYTWRQISGPELLEQPSRQPSLTLTPKAAGEYVFECVASDGSSSSRPGILRLNVFESAPPILNQPAPAPVSAPMPRQEGIMEPTATMSAPATAIGAPLPKTEVKLDNPSQQQKEFLNNLFR